MKNLHKFFTSIDNDIAWRKKEISNIILIHNENNSELIIKSSVLLIYSHWEGCVKNLCELYLNYVSTCAISISELTDNYKAIVLKEKIKQVINARGASTIYNELLVIKSIDNASQVIFKKSEKDKSIINANSNLNHEIFVSLLEVVGIGKKICLQTKKNYINQNLIQNRNKIAHGDKIDSSSDELFLDIGAIKAAKNLIFSIIDSLADDLKYYAEHEYYLSSKKKEIEKYNELSNETLENVLNSLTI